MPMPMRRHNTVPSSNVNGWQHHNPTTLALALRPDGVQQKNIKKNTRQQAERLKTKRQDDESHGHEPQERDGEERKGKRGASGAGLGVDSGLTEVDREDMDDGPNDGNGEDEDEDETGPKEEEEGRAPKRQREYKLPRVDRDHGSSRVPMLGDLGIGVSGPPRTTLSTLSSIQPYLTPAISPPCPGPGPPPHLLGPQPGPPKQFHTRAGPSMSPSSTSSPDVPTRDQRNRAAATRYRTKSKAALASLQSLEQELSLQRQELLSTLKGLEQEKYELKTELLTHVTRPGCDCRDIREYLDREARRILLKEREKAKREGGMMGVDGVQVHKGLGPMAVDGVDVVDGEEVGERGATERQDAVGDGEEKGEDTKGVSETGE